jgi:hypothetical protein
MGAETFADVEGLLRDVLSYPEPVATAELVGRIEALGLESGHSDGN